MNKTCDVEKTIAKNSQRIASVKARIASPKPELNADGFTPPYTETIILVVPSRLFFFSFKPITF